MTEFGHGIVGPVSQLSDRRCNRLRPIRPPTSRSTTAALEDVKAERPGDGSVAYVNDIQRREGASDKVSLEHFKNLSRGAWPCSAFVIRPSTRSEPAGKTIDFEAIHVPTDGTKAANRG